MMTERRLENNQVYIGYMHASSTIILEGQKNNSKSVHLIVSKGQSQNRGRVLVTRINGGRTKQAYTQTKYTGQKIARKYKNYAKTKYTQTHYTQKNISGQDIFGTSDQASLKTIIKQCSLSRLCRAQLKVIVIVIVIVNTSIYIAPSVASYF